MKIKPMHLLVAVVLCMTQMFETTTALQHQNDQNNSKFPQEVVNKIATFLNSDVHKRDVVLRFLSDHERKIVQRCIEVLRSVMDNDKTFQGLVNKLAEDIDLLNKNSDYLMDMAEDWKNVLNQNDKNNSAEFIPQDIKNKIEEYLKPSPEKLVPIVIFFSINNETITKRYIQTLRTVFDNEAAFRGVVDNLVKDTKKVNDDPYYHSIMATIWNYYLKNVSDPQQNFTFTTLLSDNSIKISQQYKNLFTILSKFAPSIQKEVIQLGAALSPLTAAMPETTKSFNQNFDRLFQGTNLVSVAKYVQVGLVVTSLTLETYDSLNLWWNGQISGENCTKTIIASCASLVGGIYGGKIGAVVGHWIAPGPAGTIIGGFAGGFIGSVATRSLSDWLTHHLFNLPRKVALANAFKFMQLNHTASNDEINSTYNRLAWEYNSKESKSQNVKNWLKLQTCMDVIRTSKGQG
jgi:hypothetical protein